MSALTISTAAPTGFPENLALRAWVRANGINERDVVAGPPITVDTGVMTYKTFVTTPDGNRQVKRRPTGTVYFKQRWRRRAIAVPPTDFGLVPRER